MGYPGPVIQTSQKPYYDATADANRRRTYYGDLADKADSMSPQELYSGLHDLLETTHTHALDYDPSKNLYPRVDLHPDGTVKSIYGDKSGPGRTSEEVIADDQRRRQEFEMARRRGGSNASDFHYNCEHVVPQSWFHKHEPMRGDLHHLFACDVPCNSLRGNALYNDFPEDPKGNCGIATPNHSHFEPAQGKGAVARATLYFLLRYPGEIGDAKGEYTAGDIPTLLKWHHEDPPNEYEFHRNAEIQADQGDRNPLIDFPQWADQIDFTQGLGAVGRNSQQRVLPGEYFLSCPLIGH